VVRNVALRYEERRARSKEEQPESAFHQRVVADEDSLSQVFDRSWARALMKRAMERQREEATTRGEDAQRRVELLRLRFQEGLPIRDIAKRWNAEASVVHRQYRTAREEFQKALVAEVRFHNEGATEGEIHRECTQLLELLA
jgi:predicted DNA-binding protein (UPF0251 family)